MQPQAAQNAQDPRIGMILQDRYRIVRKLGDGGMGSVYEGEHIAIKRRVAVKVLHSQFAQNPEIVARFHREAEAANSIGHPNIVEVTDMGRFPDGTAYMVLEFLKGRDWATDIEREGPQPLGKVVHIMSQVCDALAAAHAQGIVHRDLKPENIFLIERGGDRSFAKVLDFGISKIADASSENRSLTQTGTALGTPYYMAPEQCQGKKDVDSRADIYSLGVILFQALTRQYPFDDESYPMLVLKICTEPPPPIGHYRPDLPPQLQDIVNRMLAKDRNQRFARCEEVKAALEPFRGVNDAPIVATNAPSTASRGPSVLEQRATGPAMTPTGTAYLQSSPDVHASSPGMAAPAKKSGSGALLAVIAVIGLLVVVGGGFGAWAAVTGAFTPTRVEPTPPTAQHPPDPPVHPPEPAQVAVTPPAQGDPTPAPTAAATPPVPAPAVPATPQQVRIQITVEGPSEAEIFIDNVSYGHPPFDGDMDRDPLPAEGQAARMHTIEARAAGWRTATEQRPFTVGQRVVLRMQREGGSGRPSRMPVVTPTTGQIAPQPLTGRGNPPPGHSEPLVDAPRQSGAAPDTIGSGRIFGH